MILRALLMRLALVCAFAAAGHAVAQTATEGEPPDSQQFSGAHGCDVQYQVYPAVGRHRGTVILAHGFMRTMDSGGADPLNITKMSIGFMLPLFVVAWLQASTSKPAGWVARAIFLATLVSIGAFYGTYTFISGWGNVNWWPLMVTAVADTVSIVPGTIFIAWLQRLGSGSNAA